MLKREVKKVQLQAHREKLKDNPNAYTTDIPRCYESVVDHLKEAGYIHITYKRAPQEVEDFVNLIFETQKSRPFFHIESSDGLPFCWNSPSRGGWDIDYIKYEWGHLKSRNQNGGDALCLENLSLQSARCNQHIQSSLNVEDLLEYDGKLAIVIRENTQARKKLFNSRPWRELLNRLEKWK